ncbi:MAG TPA: dihydrofolate reductase [Thermoanaerobaculia bacterium]|jgi:dihydrofolate reductase
MRISIIAALSTNDVIGRNNELPWRLSSDLKRFKALTMGHHLIMGRKTFESVGRPLPGRTNVIVTRDPGYRLPAHATPLAASYGASETTAAPVIVVPSIEEALRVAKDDAEAFVGGGATIFEQTLHRADRMYLTRVHADVEGDTYFPDFDDVAEWSLVDSEHFEADEKNDYPFSFLTYDRINEKSEHDPHCGVEG